jgi:hypothetical protein
MRGIVGEERIGKKTDRCPLTLTKSPSDTLCSMIVPSDTGEASLNAAMAAS